MKNKKMKNQNLKTNFLDKNLKTNFLDKNSIPINVNDIVKFITKENLEDICKIIYDKRCKLYFAENNLEIGIALNENNVKNMEVVGNMKYNPELLEIETEFQKVYKEFVKNKEDLQ